MSVSTPKNELDGRSRSRDDAWRGLASRQADGISVQLYWRPRCDVIVRVTDGKTGDEFTFEPPKRSALTAFYHPYAMKEPHGSGS
jgi:hypothetical protein